MKTIYLVRHGKAVSMDTEISDFDRMLIEQGKNDVLNVTRRFEKRKVNASLIISSPAKRALETAYIVAEQLNYNKSRIKRPKVLYEQTEDALLQVLQTIDDEHKNVIIVGHNPSLENFSRLHVKNFNKNIPTSGVVGIVFKTNKWKEINSGKGKLKLFDFPREDKKSTTSKTMRKNLEKKITEQIENVLTEMDVDSAAKTIKPVKKSSTKIAKAFIKNLKSVKK